MNEIVIEFVAAIVAAALLLLFLFRNFTLRLERKQRERINEEPAAPPVETASPIPRPLQETRKRVLRSIHARFTIIRRAVAVAVILLVLAGVALPMLGTMPAVAVSALVTLTGAIVAIAARPFLENLIAGIIITFSGVIRESDTLIVSEQYGTIEDVTLTHTVVKIWNWRRLVIPNSILVTKEFISLSLYDDYEWRYVEFWVAPDADLHVVRQEAVAAARESPYFGGHEDPAFWVMELAKDGICCWVAAWANTPSEGWELANDVRSGLSRRLNDHGIACHRFQLNMSGVPGYGPQQIAQRQDLGSAPQL